MIILSWLQDRRETKFAVSPKRKAELQNILQEVRALRYLHARGPASMSVVKLLGTFTHAGHLCLVLEQLYGSLLDYVSHSSTLAPAVQLTNLRQIAFQLMVTLWGT